jgi:hypothetical protein
MRGKTRLLAHLPIIWNFSYSLTLSLSQLFFYTFKGKSVLAGDAEYFDLLIQEQPEIHRGTWLTEYV